MNPCSFFPRRYLFAPGVQVQHLNMFEYLGMFNCYRVIIMKPVKLDVSMFCIVSLYCLNAQLDLINSVVIETKISPQTVLLYKRGGSLCS